MHITPWRALVNRQNIDDAPERKIFLHKKTIVMLSAKSKE
jgi:tmRNA-binding protein